MKKILLITSVLALLALSGCKATEKRMHPAIKEKIPITGQTMMGTKKPVAGEKTALPSSIDKNAWHYSIYDPRTNEIEFYDRYNNMIWRTFRY